MRKAGFSHMLSGYMFNQNNTKELVIVAEKKDEALTNILDEIQSVYSPNSVILLKTNTNKKLLSKIAPGLFCLKAFCLYLFLEGLHY